MADDALVTDRTIELYLLRHADAGDPLAWPGDDAERPLSKKGQRQVRRLGRWLRRLGFEPDVVVTSPKVRAAETAEGVARELRLTSPRADVALAGPLDAAALQAILAEHAAGATRVVLVGHDPDFSELASWLTASEIPMPKGSLVRVDLPGGSLDRGSGVLRWLVPPDAIPKLG